MLTEPRPIRSAAVCVSMLACLWSGTATATRSHEAPGGNAVAAWNALTTDLLTSMPRPLVETRVYAIQHIAVHDVLNTIDRRYAFKVGRCRVDGVRASRASVDAAIAAASRQVLVTMSPEQAEVINAHYADFVARIPDGRPKTDGEKLGVACADAALASRANDGMDKVGPPLTPSPVYVPTPVPGVYQFTPPFDAPPFGPIAFFPGWGDLAPFAIELAEHRLPGPHPLWSLRYALDFNFVKAIGRVGSAIRTDDQSEIARFWFEPSPPGWNRIANLVIRQKQLGLWESARILALVNFAMADGFVAGFAEKYEEKFWRPETAIQQADRDGNPLTVADPAWVPFLNTPAGQPLTYVTPPVPDYPSTHTVLGAAAATVLIRFFGDRVPFTTTSPSLAGVSRSFNGFTHAAVENGLSRVYGGIHFLHAVEDGYRQGQGIGRAIARQLPRVH